MSGTARAADGTTAPYTTRIVVFRPRSQERFNGTVLLDWVNVTAQFENAVDILEAREMLLRDGYAFVHVSAQAAGLCCTPLTPQVWDPVRYADISHPGDAYADDMFTQVAAAVRGGGAGLDPLPGLRVRRVLASGQSQSANRLHDFVSTRQGAGVIDGFLIHGGGEKTFPGSLEVPVIHLLSDLEADPAPPTDDPRYRLWEVAATAHSDYFIGYQSVFGNGPRVADQPALDEAGYRDLIDEAGNYGQVVAPLEATCTAAGATMPMHYATSTALHELDRWVRTGTAPREHPRFAFTAGRLAVDEHGNTLGGIRSASRRGPGRVVPDHGLRPRRPHRAVHRCPAPAALPDLRRLPAADARGHRPGGAARMAVAARRRRPDAPGLLRARQVPRRAGALPVLPAADVRLRPSPSLTSLRGSGP